MRTFRNATIAGATALALAFGGTTVATAAEDTGRSIETVIGEKLGESHSKTPAGAETRVTTGENLWGKERGGNPQAAETLRILTFALVGVAGFLTVLAPLANFIKFGPFAK